MSNGVKNIVIHGKPMKRKTSSLLKGGRAVLMLNAVWLFSALMAIPGSEADAARAKDAEAEETTTTLREVCLTFKSDIAAVEVRNDRTGYNGFGGGFIGGVVAGVGRRYDNVADAKSYLAMVQIKQKFPEIEQDMQQFILDDLKEKLTSRGIQCDFNGESGEVESETVLELEPILVGFRFDQIWNVLYVPSYVVRVTLNSGGEVRYEKTVGIGNLGYMREYKIDKMRPNKKAGYKKPEQIGEQVEEAIARLRDAIGEVNGKIVLEVLSQPL